MRVTVTGVAALAATGATALLLGAGSAPTATAGSAASAGRTSFSLVEGGPEPPTVLRSRGEALAPQASGARNENWLALDVQRNLLYPKSFTLAAAGRRVEVWVARNLLFPSGDCRNRVDRGARVRITKAHATYLARQFDQVIYEQERRVFGVPRPRNGRAATDSRFRRVGRGERVVVLVDNVRDGNFFDRDNSRNQAYVAGFHASRLSHSVDRNVLTIDAYDWPHRLRANPPHAPVVGDNCASAPARPFMYEATLAHEYEHLLQRVVDPGELEEEWVDEGLADFAQTLSGYARPARRIDQPGFDSHVQCVLGWLNQTTRYNPQPRVGGPENSLTLWRDAGDDEILCDYGAAYTFMHVLVDRYGTRAAGELHRDQAIGLDGVNSVLARLGATEDALGLLHDWAAILALDAALDRGTPLRQGDPLRFRSPTLSASINWDNPGAYATAGAPPNGSDYVRLRDAGGRYVSAAELSTLAFQAQLPPRGVGAFTVQLVGYSSTDPTVPATQVTLGLDTGFRAALDAAQLQALFDPRADVVAAIVTYDDAAESIQRYGRYGLTVNGIVQPGG